MVAASARDLAREAIRQALAQHAGLSPTRAPGRRSNAQHLEQVASRLVPVIGAKGVDALFSRSLHLTSAAFPCWPSSGTRAPRRAAGGPQGRVSRAGRRTPHSAGYALLVDLH